jgi:Ser/Thr protein kinase RdoA (MazF antagonist)
MLEAREALAHYEIGEIHEVETAGGTAGKCWRVSSASGRYFLRCRGLRTSSREAVEFDHGFRRHLLAHGVPTAAPLATRSGTTPALAPGGRASWVLMQGRAFELYPFVEGRPFGGSRAELIETARALARFHQAAADYPARGTYNPIPMQFAIAAPEVGGSERMDDPELMAAAFERLAVHEPALGYALQQARRLCRTYSASVYGALPRWLIHGDYHPGNLLYSDSGRMAGIFDLDWACDHTRSRDLADGVYFFAGRRDTRAFPQGNARLGFDGSRIESMTEAVELDIVKAALFLRAYAEEARLEPEEARLEPEEARLEPEEARLEPEEARAIPLALRARWLAARLEGSAKMPPERRVWFITRDLERPLEWLDAHGDELVRSVL